MKKKLKWFFSSLLIICLIFVGNTLWFKPFSIDIFFERFMLMLALRNPEMLSQIRLLEPFGIRFHQRKLNEVSLASQTEFYQKLKKTQETLASYSDESINSDQRLSKAILAYFLQEQIESERWRFHDYPVNPLFGVQNEFPELMVQVHQINDLRDAEDYIIRLGLANTKFLQVIDGLEKRASLGIVPPTFVIDKVLNEMRQFVVKPVVENILISSFKDKLAKVNSISNAKRGQLIAKAEMTFQMSTRPAYLSLIDYFSELRKISNNDAGAWKLPAGDEFYAFLLKKYTNTDLSASQIHELGIEETARIQQEMMVVMKKMGYECSVFKDCIAQVASESSFYYSDDDSGRAEILDQYQLILNDAKLVIADLFDLKPASNLEIKRVLQFKEKTAPMAYYSSPPRDGSRGGIFFVNLHSIKVHPKYGMRTLAYHEGIPGHHLQRGIQSELNDIPLFRTIISFTSYIEGWALYAERLAWEAGLHDNLASNLGRLQAELFRSVRLAVDTGIHYKRWTREQAIAYMLDNTGMNEEDIIPEVERYIVIPGQATAYKMGMMKILALRDKAKRELNDNFDLKAFHTAVLKAGALPLSILEKQVDAYIGEALVAAEAVDS